MNKSVAAADKHTYIQCLRPFSENSHVKNTSRFYFCSILFFPLVTPLLVGFVDRTLSAMLFPKGQLGILLSHIGIGAEVTDEPTSTHNIMRN
jgi:hypothetical protein